MSSLTCHAPGSGGRGHDAFAVLTLREYVSRTRSGLLRVRVLAAPVFGVGLLAAGGATAQIVGDSDPAPPLRWTGSISLQRVSVHTSSDGRFALDAGLHPAAEVEQGDPAQRITVSARLVVAKALPASCAASADDLFRNGFEQNVPPDR